MYMLSYCNLIYIENTELYFVVCNSCPCLNVVAGNVELIDSFIPLIKALLGAGDTSV